MEGVFSNSLSGVATRTTRRTHAGEVSLEIDMASSGESSRVDRVSVPEAVPEGAAGGACSAGGRLVALLVALLRARLPLARASDSCARREFIFAKGRKMLARAFATKDIAF